MQIAKKVRLIDLSLFKIPSFSVATQTQFLSNGILFSGQFLIPLYLTAGIGKTASESGWLLASIGFGMMCSYPFVGYLTERFGYRTVSVIGVSLSFVGTLPFLWMVLNQFSPALAMLGLFIRGAGLS